MSPLKIVGDKLPPSQRSSLEIIAREGAFHLRSSPVLSAKCFPISCFISICPFAALSKVRTLFCLVDIKKRSFLTSCVFWLILGTIFGRKRNPQNKTHTHTNIVKYLVRKAKNQYLSVPEMGWTDIWLVSLTDIWFVLLYRKVCRNLELVVPVQQLPGSKTFWNIPPPPLPGSRTFGTPPPTPPPLPPPQKKKENNAYAFLTERYYTVLRMISVCTVSTAVHSKTQKHRWLLAFKKTNHKTQEVNNERFHISTEFTSVAQAIDYV